MESASNNFSNQKLLRELKGPGSKQFQEDNVASFGIVLSERSVQ
jgi:hypothetical protein